MKHTLRIIAVLIALAATGYWLAAGANLGWNKDQVQIKTRDEITGLDGIQWQKKFVPGFEFMAIAFGGAVFFAGISFLFRNKSITTKPINKQYEN